MVRRPGARGATAAETLAGARAALAANQAAAVGSPRHSRFLGNGRNTMRQCGLGFIHFSFPLKPGLPRRGRLRTSVRFNVPNGVSSTSPRLTASFIASTMAFTTRAASRRPKPLATNSLMAATLKPL